MCSAWASSSPARGEQRRRAVGALLDVRAERSAAQHRAHLVGDAGQPRDEDLQPRRVITRAPPIHAPAGPGSPRQPSGTHTVQSGSATHRGADHDRARPPAGSSSTSSGAARVTRARSATDLDRRTGASEAVAALRARPGSSSTVGTVSSWLWPAYRQSSQLVDGSARRPTRRASAASSARASSPSVRRAGIGHDRTSSRCSGEHRSPTAENTPARGGTITAGIPRASAIAHAWSGPAPPNATEREIARVDALLDSHHPHRALHRCVDDGDDTVGGHAGARRARRGRRRRRADRSRAARSGRDAAEHEVGVGDGRRGPPEAVARRTRDRRPRSRARPRARRRRRPARSIRRRRRWCGSPSAGSRTG